MFEQVFQGTKLCMPNAIYTYSAPAWGRVAFSKYLGAFVAIGYRGDTGTWMYRIFLDGTSVLLGQADLMLYAGPFARINGTLAFGHNTLDSPYSPRLIGAHEVSGTPNPNMVISPDNIDLISLLLVDEVNRRRVHSDGIFQQVKVCDLDTGSLLATITHNRGSSNTGSWVEPGVMAVFDYTSGKVTFIDYLHKYEVTGTGRIDPNCKLAAYDCLDRVIWAIDADGYARVYTTVSWPITLSAPAFVSTPVYGVKANPVRVRLTGEDGEASPGWWVHWTMAEPAIGSLRLDKSKTDAGGYADNIYFGPADNSPGAVTIQAAVVVP